MYSNVFSSYFRGMYVCRTLSYKGAEFEVVEAPLEAEMMVKCTHFIYSTRQKLIVALITLVLKFVARIYTC